MSLAVPRQEHTPPKRKHTRKKVHPLKMNRLIYSCRALARALAWVGVLSIIVLSIVPATPGKINYAAWERTPLHLAAQCEIIKKLNAEIDVSLVEPAMKTLLADVGDAPFPGARPTSAS